jgi:TolB-like protein/tetratricopeptide (TPR) repeat protein
MAVRFGQWIFDRDRRLVVGDDGAGVHPTPKAFDVLAVLLDRAPDVVRKSDLHEEIWRGTFVSDATLASLIKELRRALGDRGKSAPLIRTSHGVGYAFVGRLGPAEAPSRPRSSIAVLPFANIGAVDDTYFGDGLAEELTTALARLPELRVAARVSAFHFRNPPHDMQQIGKALNVDQVLEGSVLRVDRRIRITARLINVADGYHLWSAKYEREIGDVFAIQDEIAASIVRALGPALSPQPSLLPDRHTPNLEAFELYLRGRHCWHQRTPASVHTAIGCFEAAVRLDRNYALAHAGIANAYSALAFYGYLPAADARTAAGRSAATALARAPHLAESHYAMALFTMWLSPDWPAAEASYARALDIQPDYAPAHTHYAALLAACRRSDDARAHVHVAIALDPLSPAVFGTAALCMFTLGEYDAARRYGERALELQANFVVGLYALGLTYCRTGAIDKAHDAFGRLLTLSSRAAYFLGWAALACGLGGRDADVRALGAEIQDRHPSEYVHPVAHLLAAIASTDRNAALRALERCVELRGPSFQLVHATPFLDRWASEPPFATMLAQLHVRMTEPDFGHRPVQL